MFLSMIFFIYYRLLFLTIIERLFLPYIRKVQEDPTLLKTNLDALS